MDKKTNKVIESSKRNSMGIGVAVSGLIVSIANMYGIRDGKYNDGYSFDGNFRN